MKEITSKQQAILDFYIDLSKEMGRFPSITELSEKYGRSRSTVYETLMALEKKGYLQNDNGTFILPESIREENMVIQVPIYKDLEALDRGFSEDTLALMKGMGVDGESFALINHSDEMIGEGIVSGDTLVFQKSGEPENGKIVLAAIPGENDTENIVLRRYRESSLKISLIPENDSIGMITTQKCRIIGILALKLRKY